jgi:hypothetical protein
MSESQSIFIIPRKDMKIADPVANDFLPAEGREVENSTYWSRRIQDEDVVVSKATVKTPIKSSKKDV